jgi:hypothetical protein
VNQHSLALRDAIINELAQIQQVRDNVTVMFPFDVDIFRILAGPLGFRTMGDCLGSLGR